MHTKRRTRAALFAALLAAACLQSAEAGAASTSRQASQASQGQAGQTRQRLSHQDAQWLETMHQISLVEIKRGHLAQKHGHSHIIRSAGHKTVAVHAKLDSEVKHWAHRLNIVLPNSPNSNQKHALEDLEKKSGLKFDRAWLHGELTTNREATGKTRYEISHGWSKKLMGFAKKVLPLLEKYHHRLHRLSDQHARAAVNRA